ncbi:MAG: lysine 2,3-aminomutase [Bacteroidia bacterium]|nr:lysine 2,3-aminomutase [Bacteroidia bacterium]
MNKTYKAFTLSNFRQIPQVEKLSEEQRFNIEVVGNVLPFKTNNYVVDELINWDNVPNDPIFVLTFPQKDMLLPHHFDEMAAQLKSGADKDKVKATANKIREQLNPHPAGQMEHNVPEIYGTKLTGMQHKYRQTVLFFPSNGQTCHAYCTFCFRWPQFVGMDEWKFAMRETELLVKYVQEHKEVTDVLFTGGDPLIMKAKNLASYIEPLLDANIPNLQTIRIGTKSLGYWPYKYLTDDDADDTLRLFEKIVKSGKNLAIMAHFNHPVELSTEAVQKAIKRVKSTGAQIRTQSPIMRNINDSSEIWAEMWRTQVNNNCIPYYMFLARDTGAQHYFSVPLVEAWTIFQKAYQQVSGVCRTVRGPSMSCNPGKVQVLGVSEVPFNGQQKKIITLRFLQGRNPDWVARPFYAEYDENANWIDDLKPAFGEEKFFFEDELCKYPHFRTS